MCASVFLMCLIYSQVPSLLGHSPLYIRGALRVPLCCFSALCGHINDQQIVNFTVSFLLFRKHITAFLGQFQHVFSFYIANKRFFLHPRFSFYFLNKRVEFSFYFLNKQISYWCNFSFYFANKHVSERCEFSFYFVNTWR